LPCITKDKKFHPIFKTILYLVQQAHRVKNIAYFSSTVWSLLCLLASDFPSENPRTQTRNVPYT